MYKKRFMLKLMAEQPVNSKCSHKLCAWSIMPGIFSVELSWSIAYDYYPELSI